MTRFSWRKAALPLTLALGLSPAFAGTGIGGGVFSLLGTGTGGGMGYQIQPKRLSALEPEAKGSVDRTALHLAGNGAGGGGFGLFGTGLGGGAAGLLSSQKPTKNLVVLKSDAMGHTDCIHLQLAGLSTGGSLGVIGSSLGGIRGLLGTGVGGGGFGIAG